MNLPPVPESFRWTDESWGVALRCRPLDRLARHLFSTRQLQLSTSATVPPEAGEAGWHALAVAMGIEEGAPRLRSGQALRRVRQVHGNRVIVVRRAGGEDGRLVEADAIISDDPAVAIAVVAADCVPLLLADRRTGVVGAVHAGWRGTAARVAPAAVEALRREFGSVPEDLVAAIGPSIGGCCYEVGSELVDAFAAAGHERYLIDRWFHAPPPPRGRRPGPSAAEGPGLRLDIAGANRDQLILSGVPEGAIHIAGLCTAMNLELLTSYRVEKEGAGRIAGVIRARGHSQGPPRTAQAALRPEGSGAVGGARAEKVGGPGRIRGVRLTFARVRPRQVSSHRRLSSPSERLADGR